MRIVKRKEFLTLPQNTLYCKYDPCVFSELMIKHDTLKTNDWVCQQIADAIKCDNSEEFGNKLQNARVTGESVEMDFDCAGRDGCYEPDNALFAVYETEDIKQLIEVLKACIPTTGY